MIKGALSVFILILVIKNRKYATIPRGLGLLIAGLTLAVAGVAVLWP